MLNETVAPGEGLRLLRCDKVQPKKVDWWWPGFIPKGKTVTLEGDPGLGKSTFAADIAARLTNGAAMPDGSLPSGACNVLLLSAEDSAADTMKPRLAAHGAEEKCVFFLPDDADFCLPRAIDRLRDAVIDNNIGFVVIDPFHAFLDGKVDPHKDADIRRVLRPLTRLCDETGATVMIVRHLNKNNGGSAIYRGNGSIGVIAAGRLGLLMAVDPTETGRVVLAVAKTNLARKPKSLAFRVIPSFHHECSKLDWQGEVALDADDLVSGRPEGGGKLQRAKVLIVDILRNGDELATVIEAEARQQGISKRTLDTAKAELNIGHYQKARPGRTGLGPCWWTIDGDRSATSDPRDFADQTRKRRKVRKPST